MCEKYDAARPSALIRAGNAFELTVAAAISLFDFHSDAEPVTVVGMLIEVPLMHLVVRMFNHSRTW